MTTISIHFPTTSIRNRWTMGLFLITIILALTHVSLHVHAEGNEHVSRLPGVMSHRRLVRSNPSGSVSLVPTVDSTHHQIEPIGNVNQRRIDSDGSHELGRRTMLSVGDGNDNVDTVTGLSPPPSCSTFVANCTYCTSIPYCGWCPSNYPNVPPACLPGNMSGASPTSPQTCELVDWNFGPNAECHGDQSTSPSQWPSQGVVALTFFIIIPIVTLAASVMTFKYNRRVLLSIESPLSTNRRNSNHTNRSDELEDELERSPSSKSTSPIEVSGRRGRLNRPNIGTFDWSSRYITYVLIILALTELILKLVALGLDEWDSEYYPGTSAFVSYGLVSGRSVYPSTSAVVTSYISMCHLMSGINASICWLLVVTGDYMIGISAISCLLSLVALVSHMISLRFPYLRGQFSLYSRNLISLTSILSFSQVALWCLSIHWLVHTMDNTANLGTSFYLTLTSALISMLHVYLNLRSSDHAAATGYPEEYQTLQQLK